MHSLLGHVYPHVQRTGAVRESEKGRSVHGYEQHVSASNFKGWAAGFLFLGIQDAVTQIRTPYIVLDAGPIKLRISWSDEMVLIALDRTTTPP